MITILVLWKFLREFIAPTSKSVPPLTVADFPEEQNNDLTTHLRCWKDLPRLSTLEDDFKRLPFELAQLASTIRTQALNRSDEQWTTATSSTIFQNCISGLGEHWSWLKTLLDCGTIHLDDASRYHQYYHLVNEYRSWLTTDKQRVDAFFNCLKTEEVIMEQVYENRTLEAILQLIQEWKERISGLHGQSKAITPISFRIEPLGSDLVFVELLSDYAVDEVLFRRGRQFRLLDNSSRQFWSVEAEGDNKVRLPSTLLRIRPPDFSAIEACSRLAVDFQQLWTDRLNQVSRILQTNLIESINANCRVPARDDFEKLGEGEKKTISKTIEVIKARMIQDVDVDKPDDGCGEDRGKVPGKDPAGNEFADSSQLKEGLHLETELLTRLSRTEWMIDRFKEFRHQSRSLLTEIDIWCRSIEMSVPTRTIFDEELPISGKHVIELETWGCVDGVGHESARKPPGESTTADCNLTKSKVGLQFSEMSDQVDSRTRQTHERRRLAETAELTRSEQEENFAFIITGVLNPSNLEMISLEKATRLGIIDLDIGTYNDRSAKRVLPIRAAMDRGLIEYVLSSAEKTTEKRSSTFIITIQTKRDPRPYRVTEVIDAQSERKLTVAEATAEGIIDEENGLYKNRVTGKTLTLNDAVDLGLLVVAFDDEDAEKPETSGSIEPSLDTKTYALQSVVDVETGQHLTFLEAVSRRLIDENSGEYINSSTAERMDVEEAIRKGFIRGTVLEDPTSTFDIPPENRIVLKRRVLGKIRAIAALRKTSKKKAAAEQQQQLMHDDMPSPESNGAAPHAKGYSV